MITIAVTSPSKDREEQERYAGWVRRHCPHVNVELLSLNNEGTVEDCAWDGLILSGGGDVHPRHYGREDALPLVRRTDEERDRFEFDMFRRAAAAGTPVFGICRGAQLVNTALGGTLIPDLPMEGYADHSRTPAGERRHAVRIEQGTLLHGIARMEKGEVNSSHHQAAGVPGKGLTVSARSDDGVIEALEWSDPARQPFLLLVQWHPERMDAGEAELSASLLHRFVKEVERFAASHEHRQSAVPHSP